jgi:hypothetical protein
MSTQWSTRDGVSTRANTCWQVCGATFNRAGDENAFLGAHGSDRPSLSGREWDHKEIELAAHELLQYLDNTRA